MKSASDKARAAGLEVEVELHNAKGKRVALVLQELADAGGATLIIMGTHGRTGFEYLLMGSVAEELIRVAKTPLLLIHGNG